MEDNTNEANQVSDSALNQASPAPQPVVASAPKSNKKKFILGGILLFIVLAGGVLAGVYTHLNNKPEKVLADAFVNTIGDVVDKKPMTSVGALSFESKGSTPVKLSLKIDSKTNGKDGQGSADVTVEFAGKEYSIKGSGVVFGEDEVYVKVERLREAVRQLAASQPALGAYEQMVQPIVSKVDNQWIKITKDDLKELGMANEDTIDKCSVAVQNIKLSKSDKKQMKKLFKENQFIVAGETLENENISGEKSFHYKLDFNNKAAENFAKQVITMESLSQIKKDCEFDEEKIEESFSEQQSSSSSDSKVKPVVELWVGKKSRRPTQFKLTAKDTEFSMDFNTQVKFDADNIVVEKPANSISVQELKREIENLVPGATQRTSGFDTL
jgi:hypothetical protein